MQEFNNTPNEEIIHPATGKRTFLSRSMAVCVAPFREDKVLLVKRGQDMQFAGKWCLPCGYLDWNETLDVAAIRELYEETGYRLASEEFIYFRHIDSNPESNLQNVTAFFTAYPDEDDKDLNWIPDSGEVEEVAWVSVNEALEYDLAFNHLKIIAKFA